MTYTRGNDLSGSLEGAGGIGGLLARSSGYSGGNWTTHNFYHADGNGNVTYMVNSSQAMVANYRYDPYGRMFSYGGTLWAQNVYRFSSKEVHDRSGLYYYLYRFYDPSVQRWVNRDPVEEEAGLNLYSFVSNEPVGFFDLVGLDIGRPIPGSAHPTANCLSYALAPCTFGGENMGGLGAFPKNQPVSYHQMQQVVENEMTKRGCKRIKSHETCPKGTYEIDVFYWWEGSPPNQDPAYHCIRQDPDGTWSQRNGPKLPVFTGGSSPTNPGIPAKTPRVKYCCPSKPAS